MPVLTEFADNIEYREDGLWIARSQSAVSYPDDGNTHCFAVEDSSFWFAHRNQCLIQLLRRFPPPGTLFDIGGGNGFVAHAFEQAGYETVLVEPGPVGVRNARTRGVRQVVQGTLSDLGLRAGAVPAFGLFDVIEHVENDGALLAELYRLQAPRGRAYFTVPAHSALWSHEDVTAGHFRRYRLAGLLGSLERAGFRVEFATTFFSFLTLPIFLLRAVPYRLGGKPRAETEASVRADHQAGSFERRVLDFLMQREMTRILRLEPRRWGASCLIAARK